MLTSEINTIARGLTKPQRDVLLMLDGIRINDLELNGTYTRVVKTLADKGLITYRRTNKTISYGPARGSHTWSKSRVVLIPQLTKLGSDFIYEGGLDR